MADEHRTDSSTPRRPPGPASIQDVADEAHVSIATVSRVINGHQLVAHDTAARVKAAIERLEFRPNRFAQGLMTRRSKLVGLAVPDLHGDFYSTILRAADAAARKAGYHLLISTLSSHSEKPSAPSDHDAACEVDDPLASLPLSLLDGVAVMITEPNRRAIECVKAMSMPVVVVDLETPEIDVDMVLVDNITGAREATEHLLSTTSPRKIRFVGGPANNFDTVQRSRALREVLDQEGLDVSPCQIRFGDYTMDWGRQWALEAAAKGELAGCGVLAGNDEIAWGIMLAAQEVGVSIPSQLRVVGFDNTRLSTLTRPLLSTVHIPVAQIGASALELLSRRISDQAAPRETVRLSTRLIVRETS